MKKLAVLWLGSLLMASAVAQVNINSPSAQRPGQQQKVNGYSMLDANRVYSPGDKVKVEEPHGVYTGLISMDDYYFLRPPA